MKFMNNICVLAVLSLLLSCSNKSTVSEPPPPPPPAVADTSTSKIVYWTTSFDGSQRLRRRPALPYSPRANTFAIELDSTLLYQEMEGFGYTLTGGSATLINNMESAAKMNLLNELFGTGSDAIHVSYLRLSIGASDLSSEVYTYNDMPPGQTDPSLSNFSLQPDATDLIPLLKQIIAINPDMKFIATPWTPPVWMKDNDSSVGGSLKPEFYGSYANYFVKYIQAMQQEGITIHAITPQNEPLHDGNNPSLLMEAAQQADFIKNHLGPALQQAGLATKIIIYDHNCDKPEYPLLILNDPAAKSFVHGSAFHLYAGDISAMSQVHEAHPDRNIYFTEQYTSSDGNFGGDLNWHIRNLIIGAPRNWSRTVFEWNLANDVNFGPHTPGGCTTCKGALTINGSEVERNVAYYIIAHISKFVPPGSVRMNSNEPIKNVAFLTPTGQKVLIVLNEGTEAATFDIIFNFRSASATLQAGEVATFIID